MNPVTAPIAPIPSDQRRLEQLVDELAALVAQEHSLRTRAEDDRARLEEAANELAGLVAHEKAEHDRANALAREALARAEVESEWRRRLKAADRRARKELLKQL